MNDVRFAPVDAPEREAATEPPKRWRNWWLSRSDVIRRTGERFPAGTAYEGDRLWPSKDAAETAALNQLREDAYLPDQYIGAYPEGERP